jgi:hypothetical protein
MVLGGVPLEGWKPGYWSQTYWGGAVAALGGALLLGGMRRVISETRWTSAVAMGSGAAILAMSRPYEGLLVCVPVGLVLMWWLFTSREAASGRKLLQVVLPAACVAGAGLAWLLYYNWRVTGHPLLLPHTLYARQHPYVPVWVWQSPGEVPTDLNQQMYDFFRFQVSEVLATARALPRSVHLYRTLAFEAGAVLAPLVILMLPWTMRGRWIAFAGAASAFVILGMYLPAFIRFHYHAPAAALTMVLVVGSLRRVALMRGRFGSAGRRAAAILVAVTLLVACVQWIANARRVPLVMEHWMSSRQEIIDQLTQSGGRHVVFVRYGPNHSPHIEVVFNGADVDGAPVVWVRELDGAQNAKVLEYYPDRTPWLMVIDDDRGLGRIGPWPARAGTPPVSDPTAPPAADGPG